jgi:hypothetical protein
MLTTQMRVISPILFTTFLSISRFVLDVSGQIKQYTWLANTNQWNLFWAQPKTQCEVYAFCGAFGSCNGKSLPFCSCLRGFVPEVAERLEFVRFFWWMHEENCFTV